jgi:hypothetical protein
LIDLRGEAPRASEMQQLAPTRGSKRLSPLRARSPHRNGGDD